MSPFLCQPTMNRTVNHDEVFNVIKHYPDYFTFDSEEWLSCETNFAIKEGDNIGFAEHKGSGSYWVHFCYHTERGRSAIELTKQMLVYLHSLTGFTSVVGLIDEGNRKARWLIRQVGLNSLGMVETKNGLCEMFYSTGHQYQGISQDGI